MIINSRLVVVSDPKYYLGCMLDLSRVYTSDNAPLCVVHNAETSTVLSSGETAGEAVRDALRIMSKERMIKEGYTYVLL